MDLPSCVRIDAEDVRSRDALVQDGWREVEILETWVRHRNGLWPKFVDNVRFAEPSDLLACQAIANTAFQFSRLHCDSTVAWEDANAFKREWVRKAFEEHIHDIFVHLSPDADRRVDGFLICKPDTGTVRIDLIATAKERRVKGVAWQLVGFAHDWYAERNVMIAGTSQKNRDARMMYQKMGFRVVKTQRTLHKFL